MVKSIFKQAYQIITEEYEIFTHLSLKLRIAAALALSLFYFSMVILTHVTLYPYIIDSPKSATVLSIIYFFVASIAILTVLPILFPSLKKKSSVAIFALIALNFFPLILLILLIPKLKEYRTVIISVVVFMSIFLAGLIIMFEGISEGVLSQVPDATSIILWVLGLVSIFAGIFIYGHVTEKTSVEKTRMETEIAIAQKIQSQLVPLVNLRNERYTLFGKTVPAYEIGGDFFDIIEASDKKLILAIGDVSGHNIAAGLLMAITKGAFRTALQHNSSLENVVEMMNKTIKENSDKRMFVSFKCCEINLENNIISAVNAGHLPLLYYKKQDGTIREYNKPGLALGITRNAIYKVQKINFKKGDHIYLLTDGILEVMNSNNEQFGLKRVKDLIAKNPESSEPEFTYNSLMSSIESFKNSKSIPDDITFLSMKF